MITTRFSVSHLGPFKTSTMKLFAKIRIQSEISACLRILRYTYNQSFLVGNYTFKVNNRSTKTRCGIYLKLKIKTPERRLPSFWCLPSRHVLKTSSTRLQRSNFTSSKTSWRRLTKTSWRRLEDVFKTSHKTSWKTKDCYAEDVLKTSWRHVLKTSWRHILKTSSRRLGGKQNFYWWYLYLANLNVYLTNLCFTNYIWEN